jgi:uncharacterized protein (DUF1015 family)
MARDRFLATGPVVRSSGSASGGSGYHRRAVPTLRPFRALRYDPSLTPSLERLICPPYDVISDEQRQVLATRDPYNAVHLELPLAEPGDEPDEPYRRVARTIAAWRTEGVLRKDERPSVYIYEQAYRVADGEPRRQRGLLARLKLEPFEAGSGVLRHERTLSGPKEDRYRLLRATGVNLSPVVGLYRSEGGSRELIDRLVAGPPDEAAVDDEGVSHRLWAVPADDSDLGGTVSELLAVAAGGPITIADGHHRYETALRYRDDRGRACESDPPFDYVLTLLFDIQTERLTVLPTHRLVRGSATGSDLWAALEPLAEVEPVAGREGLLAAMSRTTPEETGRDGSSPRIAVWSAGEGAILRPRRERIEDLVGAGGSSVLRELDASILSVLLEDRLGIGPAESAAGQRLLYTKDAAEAIEQVDAGRAEAAFLLDPTPVGVVVAVAEAGEVMPQKSTYFYPKAATGLLFNPLEP